MREGTHFPDGVLEHIFSFITSHRDRNSLSLVCKTWYKVERFCRQRVLISNCYTLVPKRLIARFPELKSLTLKGKPHVKYFDLPAHWGGFAYPWIEALSKGCPWIEELRLKRMVVSDPGLRLISDSFPKFKSLALVDCEGFSTDGLAEVAANCRFLEVLDLERSDVKDVGGDWLSRFPDSFTSLVSLNFSCLRGVVNLVALEELVARCPNMHTLRLSRTVPFDSLQKILDQAPQLVDLGIGSFVQNTNTESYSKFRTAIRKCKSLQTLSGFLEVAPHCLPAIYPICSHLISLDLSAMVGIRACGLTKLLQLCPKLQRLWIVDSLGDKGLEVVASTCQELLDLRLFPFDVFGLGDSPVTEEGLIALAVGCPKLHSLQYVCRQMTNAALITIAKNRPNFSCFKLSILGPKRLDPGTSRPLDEGIGAIVESCKGLRQLSLSGHLTDQVFLYIGMYAEQLEELSIECAGESDKGMVHVLNGCRNLRKLEINNSPFGDDALQVDTRKYEAMRFLWMSSCKITMEGCNALARNVPMLNVEIISEKDPKEDNPDESMVVEKMYVYRALDGPRKDAPDFVWSI